MLVSAEIEGAATLIVKNQNAHTQSIQTATSPSPIPPTTLAQAGTFSICASKAWETKAVMSAWWVNWDQVSKTVKETGDYIEAVGKFVIAGNKNYLPPAQLALGYAVLWVTGEANQGYLEGEQATAQLEQPGEEGAAEEKEGDDDGEQLNNEESEPEGEESDDEEFPDVQIQSEGEESEEHIKTDNEGESTPDVKESETSIPARESVDVGNEGNGELRAQASGKKYFSAKERRELKKGKNSQATTSPLPPPSPTPGEALKTDSTQAQSSAQAPRGKKHTSKHKKKLAERYALLSDDEREIARELLGVGGSTLSGAGTLSVDTASGKALSKEDAKAAEELAQRQKKKEQHLRVQALGKAAEAKRFGWKLPTANPAVSTLPLQVSTGENLEKGTEEVDGEGEFLSELQQEGPLDFTRLAGTPSNAAGISDAIPVCAPYSALGRYKYKVKLLPAVGGASKDVQKKGKAVKDIVGGWVRVGEPVRPGAAGRGGTGGGVGKGRGVGMGFEGWDEHGVDMEKMWPREWELLKNWRAEEILYCVPVSWVRFVGVVGGGKAESGKGKAGGKGWKGKDKDEGGKAGKGGKKK